MLKNVRTVIVLLVSLAVVSMATGCATVERGPSDEEALADLLKTYLTSFKEGNVERLLSLYSKDYESAGGGGYEEMAERLEQMVPRNAERGVAPSTDETGIMVDGDTATIGPITFGSGGGVVVTLLTTKEAGGVWRITGSDVQH
jgi:hypothetical protein